MRNTEKYRNFTINTEKYSQKSKYRKIQKYRHQSHAWDISRNESFQEMKYFK